MNTITHALMGLALSEALMLNPAITVIGAVMPDFDYLFGITHRGITHSALFLIISCFIVLKWRGKRSALSLLIGLSSHLILDLITTMGVPLLWPLNYYFSFGLTSSSNPVSNLGFVLASLLIIYHKDSVNEFLFSLRSGQALKGVGGFIILFFGSALFFPVPNCSLNELVISDVLNQSPESLVLINASICSEVELVTSKSGNLYQVFSLCDESGNISVWKGEWVLENNLSEGDVISICGKFTDKFSQPEVYYVKSVVK